VLKYGNSKLLYSCCQKLCSR